MMELTIEIHAGETDAILPELRQAICEAMLAMNLLPSWTEHSSDEPAIVYCNGKKIWQFNNSIHQTKEAILHAITKASQPPRSHTVYRQSKKYFSFFIALLIAFFPKCPFCWAAYMSAFGVLGADSIPYKKWYLPLAVVLLLINIVAVYLTGNRHQYKPLLLTIAGAGLIISNRLWFDSMYIMITGMILLIIGSAWNSLPRMMTASLKNLFR